MHTSLKLSKCIWHLLVGIMITSVIGFYIPKALFVSGFIIALDLFKLSYSEVDDKDFKSDIYYFLSIVVICGLSTVLLSGICNFLPNKQSCSNNYFHARMFAVISFPLFMGTLLWVTIRLPKILKIIFRK